MIDRDKFREYVLDTARARGVNLDDEDAMHDLSDELMWEWLDLEKERLDGIAGKSIIIDKEVE